MREVAESAELHPRLRRLVQAIEDATDLAPEDRQSFFDRTLRDDPELLSRASRLLHLHTTDLLGIDPTRRSNGQQAGPREPVKVDGDRLGPYRVVGVLGEGGMGRVYLAERDDGEVERRVAIKVISGRKRGPQVHQRFLAERQILAGLDHANIARMFDAGTTDDGRSFLVMEAVDGLPIDRFCVENQLSLSRRIELFKKVAAAVSHAHQRLVVHRDLKPSNILVDQNSEPKLLDFGIAKLMDPSTDLESSRTGSAMTPKWASPEQLRGELITTATDVYSLGLLLYKVLTGRLPHDPDISLADLALRTYEKDTPVRPSRHLEDPRDTARAAWPQQDLKKVRRSVAGDLDNIVLKTLRHEPTERYRTVEALLDDLQRLDAGEPVSATRGTALYLAKKFIGRHRWPAALVTLILTFATSFSIFQEHQAQIVREEARRTETANAFLADLFGDADERIRAGKTADLKSMLDAGMGRIRSGEIEDPRVRAQILLTLGNSYLDLSLWSEALGALKEAEQLFRNLDSKRELAEALARKSLALVSISEIGAARKVAAEARSHGFPELDALLNAYGVYFKMTLGEIGESVAAAYAELDKLPEQELPSRSQEIMNHVYQWASALNNSGYLQASQRLFEYQYRLDAANGFRDILRTVDGLGRPFKFSRQWQECARLYDLVVEVHDSGQTHLDSTARTSGVFSSGLCLALSGATQAGLDDIEEGLRQTFERLRKAPNDIRALYHVGIGHQYRAMVFEAVGEMEARNADLQKSREVFERLLKDHSHIIYLHNAYAMTLMMQGEIDKAKPMVERLLWRGWRRPDFVHLAESTGALPDDMPPPLELRVELPPKIQAYLDSLPETPLPWEDSFQLDAWRRSDG